MVAPCSGRVAGSPSLTWVQWCAVQVILALINNWESTGSAEEIAGWAGFQACPRAMALALVCSAVLLASICAPNMQVGDQNPIISAYFVMTPRTFLSHPTTCREAQVLLLVARTAGCRLQPAPTWKELEQRAEHQLVSCN